MVVTAVGFTGTREGLTPVQAGMLGVELCRLFEPGAVFSHGDCVGADDTGHDIAIHLGFTVHVHPPIIVTFRAYKHGHYVHGAATYRIRNTRIVNHSDVLVACPAAPESEAARSGTWMTVRIARTYDVPVRVVWPDGSVTDDETGRH